MSYQIVYDGVANTISEGMLATQAQASALLAQLAPLYPTLTLSVVSLVPAGQTPVKSADETKDYLGIEIPGFPVPVNVGLLLAQEAQGPGSFGLDVNNQPVWKLAPPPPPPQTAQTPGTSTVAFPGFGQTGTAVNPVWSAADEAIMQRLAKFLEAEGF